MLEAGVDTVESDDLKGALRQVFGPVDDALLALISSKLEIVDVAGGSPLFLQGDPGDSLYIHIEKLRHRRNVWKFKCEAKVEDALVAQATIAAMIMDT